MSNIEELKNLSPDEAYDLLQNDSRALLVDIRSNMEFLFVGHPKGAIHVPWIDEPDWVVNPHFVTEIRQLLLGGISEGGEGSASVILICRSGKRSVDAGKVLLEAGVPNVYHVSEGFEGGLDDDHHRSSIGGWRFHGLPWEQC
ncbi:MAG: rhodanese-like domain-containing protein [Gammaproteobacteria bacterium]|nr:rhodanese-like domain-containing protein [Gammaproteobacteria bacterium]